MEMLASWLSWIGFLVKFVRLNLVGGFGTNLNSPRLEFEWHHV